MNNPLIVAVVACLTLGLSPYFPEPHVVGKIRWVAGGAHGMTATDWFDLAMHGAPWIALVALLMLRLLRRENRSRGGADGG